VRLIKQKHQGRPTSKHGHCIKISANRKRLVDSFLAEVLLEKPQTLDRLNQLLAVWLEECYQHKPHAGLGGNITTYAAYQSDKHPLKYINPEILASAFMHCKERKVDKSVCISFQGRKYEVGLAFIGCKVSVIYDPADTSELTIEYEGHKPFRVRQMVIGEHSGKRPGLPEYLLPEPARSSRCTAPGFVNTVRQQIVECFADSIRHGHCVQELHMLSTVA